ncbi:hypothetical protein NLI96_g5677 [Meripilus lineatus]|uniref:Uncharacterized protein n=1 Tax=Meripilus lineatus TaxID=2056292 RepID=A0AAD5V2G3_9APHY|nr:hypothetical protein NLI96_g5677 [Physisporinus lineatus]
MDDIHLHNNLDENHCQQVVAMPTTLIFQVFYQVLPELYLNSLLASLNERNTLRDQIPTSDHVSLPLTPLQGANPSLLSHYGQTKMIGVQIETVTEQKHDHNILVRDSSPEVIGHAL